MILGQLHDQPQSQQELVARVVPDIVHGEGLDEVHPALVAVVGLERFQKAPPRAEPGPGRVQRAGELRSGAVVSQAVEADVAAVGKVGEVSYGCVDEDDLAEPDVPGGNAVTADRVTEGHDHGIVNRLAFGLWAFRHDLVYHPVPLQAHPRPLLQPLPVLLRQSRALQGQLGRGEGQPEVGRLEVYRGQVPQAQGHLVPHRRVAGVHGPGVVGGGLDKVELLVVVVAGLAESLRQALEMGAKLPINGLTTHYLPLLTFLPLPYFIHPLLSW